MLRLDAGRAFVYLILLATGGFPFSEKASWGRTPEEKSGQEMVFGSGPEANGTVELPLKNQH